MLRKHINQLNLKELENLPFYSWNCITLQLANRMIDLVIKDEKDMFLFIQFLAYRMQTVDGIKNSAMKYIRGKMS